MTLDLVVARVATALGRGHALFSPAPLDAAPGLSGSSADVDVVVEQDRGLAADAGRLGAVRERLR